MNCARSKYFDKNCCDFHYTSNTCTHIPILRIHIRQIITHTHTHTHTHACTHHTHMIVQKGFPIAFTISSSFNNLSTSAEPSLPVSLLLLYFSLLKNPLSTAFRQNHLLVTLLAYLFVPCSYADLCQPLNSTKYLMHFETFIFYMVFICKNVR